MNREQFVSRAALVVVLLATFSTGCSLRKIAVNRFGAIAGGARKRDVPALHWTAAAW